jgi:integrase
MVGRFAPVLSGGRSRLWQGQRKSKEFGCLTLGTLMLRFMLRQGVHPKIVSERLDHSPVDITLHAYSHILPGLQEAAARRFEEGLGEISDESPATIVG